MPGGQYPKAMRDRIDAAARKQRAAEQQIGRQRRAAEAAARPGADERPAAVHCWVLGPPESPGPFPGIVTSWRRLPWGGWSGRVTYAIPRADADTLIAQQWLDDGQIVAANR